MAKTCIFCGQFPEEKSKEHVIPKWLIEATGDPKRLVSFGTYNPKTDKPKTFAFDRLTFPACSSCNGNFSGLEARTKAVMGNLLERKALSSDDFNTLLDWLDKVRIGMWLGLMLLDGNPWEITPKFHISQRIRLRDRSVGICLIKEREPGINLIGPESPCFGVSPTTMGLLINQVGLFNSSAFGLCSRRLGFPFPTEYSLHGSGQLQATMASGLERILKPVERIGEFQSIPFIYQPIFEGGIDPSDTENGYNTDYVRTNSLDFNTGLGSLFLQRVEGVSKYSAEASTDWMPTGSLSLRETYRTGRRWAYGKLELHNSLESPPKDSRGRAFQTFHKRLLTLYEQELG